MAEAVGEINTRFKKKSDLEEVQYSCACWFLLGSAVFCFFHGNTSFPGY